MIRKKEKLVRQMMGSLGKRSKFAHFDKRHFSSAAKLFVQAGFSSWTAISKLDDETRRFLREDLRKKHKCSALDLSLINDIFAHYENEKPRRTSSRDPKREPPYEEIVIPQKMERWAVDLSSLVGLLVPDQDMTNVFSKEFYEASKKEPPFTPFVVPKFEVKPWMAPLQSHERAAKYWRENIAHKNRDPSQQVSLQAWILYLLRFILTGDLCNAWKEFGGLSAQLCHLSVVLHLGVTENGAFAIAYDTEMRLRLQRLARRRDSSVNFAKFLSEENDEVKRYLKSDLGKGRPPQTTERPPPKKPFGKKNNKGDNPNFIPTGNKGAGNAQLSQGQPNWVPRVRRKGKGSK